jgi:seryl-tRNA synthetase
MLDIAWMRENQDVLAEGMTKLGAGDAPWREALNLDFLRRRTLVEVEELRRQRNEKSKEIGNLFKYGRQEEGNAMRKAVAAVNDQIVDLEESLRGIDTQLLSAMLQIPNLPEPDVPVSESEEDYVVVKEVGAPPVFPFPAKSHWEIGEQLGILDLERGVKMSGSRQYILKNAGAKLQRALSSWCLDILTTEFGFEEVYPPFMVHEGSMVGTGNLPKFGEELYRDQEEGLWLIPTAEVPVTNMYREEILPYGSLPISHVACTPCFRKEKVHAGRHARGIQRVHQFQKVEMVKFVEPEQGASELENLTVAAETMLERLGLAYRRILIPSGDLSFVAAKKIDLEIWGAGSAEWLEVSSCAWFRDFQARRANIRFRPAVGEKPRFVHTLNGSGLALPRIIIGILESFQQEDGSVILPEVIQPYMGGIERISLPA